MVKLFALPESLVLMHSGGAGLDELLPLALGLVLAIAVFAISSRKKGGKGDGGAE